MTAAFLKAGRLLRKAKIANWEGAKTTDVGCNPSAIKLASIKI